MASHSSYMSSTSSIDKNCFYCNTHSDVLRDGWPVRSGGKAMLCNRCASIYEDGSFCSLFHSDASGWRKCVTCEKNIHCGCIMSIHTHVELDSGGVECNPCIANRTSTEPMPSNASPQIPEEQRNASGIEIVIQIEPISTGSISGVLSQEEAPARKHGKQPVTDSPDAADTYSEEPQGAKFTKDTHFEEPQGDATGKTHSYCRYWPEPSGKFTKDTHSEEPLGDATGKTHSYRRYSPEPSENQMSIIKIDDADPKNGRLVIPKKCAKEHLPELSQPEGFHITMQDTNGDDWKFRYRFWPNNNSTMYVLEGTRHYFFKHQCKAGDKVTFYRIEPEGKLVMGVTKAPATSGTSSEAAKASKSDK